MREPETAVVLIAGPTASGKSRLALELAAERGGIVVNADSMQVYRELRVLTARPSLEDEAGVPHRLYGHVSAATRHSTGAWLAEARTALDEARRAGRPAIFVGGTGLYFKALTEGLSAIPPIPPDVRESVRVWAGARDAPALHAALAAVAPADAAAIRPSDRARIVRAMEVFRATGRPLGEWHKAAGVPLVSVAERIVLDPDRDLLHRRIAERAARMLDEGAVEEVRALAALAIPPDMPAMKAIGVREILDLLGGRIAKAEAVERIAAATRQYARRQLTWFRNQMAGWPRRAA
ncbi:MAG TPA: tRNA (adenosine(37)-N6)-dimethylallyltransferase MiaA [Bauldia sp.]|nr:tRNA (adenosine(37)-N6)-dimethylallyltransferase MiaA [Bauldia sp.]